MDSAFIWGIPKPFNIKLESYSPLGLPMGPSQLIIGDIAAWKTLCIKVQSFPNVYHKFEGIDTSGFPILPKEL